MRPFEQINVIPFIDIMLVLLAIVLTTATFIVHSGLGITLPESATRMAPPSGLTVELAIDQQQRIYFEGQPVGAGELEDLLRKLPPETPLVLSVDARVPFARFVEVVEALKAHDPRQLTILTRNPQ